MATLTFTTDEIWLKGTGEAGQGWSPTISGIPSGANVSKVTLSFACGNTYNAPGAQRVYWGTSSSGTSLWSFSGNADGKAYSVDLTSRITGNGTYSLYFYKTKNSGGTQSNVYFSGITITVEYDIPYTACGAPTSCSVSSTLATGDVTLSWSGASAGTQNGITGYEIQRCESSDGSSWGSWAALTTVSTSATSGSTSVAPPSTAGNYYKYRVRTLGAAGSSYYSGWKESTNTLRRNWTACGAPTACSVSEIISNSNATLSWAGSTDGYGNTITGYEVQRCESSDGASWGSWSALETTTGTSLSVAPSSTYGNYYKYRVRAQGSAGSSYYSGWKESTNSLRRDHAPIDAFTDPVLTAGMTPIKAIHMQEMQDRVATLRAFYGLSEYRFSTVTAGQTSLAGWTEHVNEIRAAVDDIGKAHDSWVEIGQNVPTVSVMQQLRDIILAI